MSFDCNGFFIVVTFMKSPHFQKADFGSKGTMEEMFVHFNLQYSDTPLSVIMMLMRDCGGCHSYLILNGILSASSFQFPLRAVASGQ